MFDAEQKTQFDQMMEMERFRQRLIQEEKPNLQQAVKDAQAAGQKLLEAHERGPKPRKSARKSLSRAKPGGGDEEFLSPVAGGFDSEALLRMSHVPTALVHVFDPAQDPLVSFTVKNTTNRDLNLRYQTHVEGYTAHAVAMISIDKADKKDHEIQQLPTFFPEQVRSIREATRATVHVELHDLESPGGQPKLCDHRTFRVWLLPQTTSILWQEDPATGKYRDRRKHLVSWVTPNAPAVMDLLRAAAEHTADRNMVGYQVPAEGVEEQVKATFQAIKDADLLYVNSVLAAGSGDTFVQRVRLPRESIQRRSMNCIDGTVLYASVLEAASLQPGIVLIPGHAFLAWRKQRDGEWDFFETTMTASHDFDAAHDAANYTYEQYEATGKATILDVAALRREGYLPLE